MRKEVKSLVYGELVPLTETGDVIAYWREAWNGHPAVNVVLNWSSLPQPWPVAAPGEKTLFANSGTIDSNQLRPWESVIFLAESDVSN